MVLMSCLRSFEWSPPHLAATDVGHPCTACNLSSTPSRAGIQAETRLATIGRIEAVLPDLGSHLDRSIVTGTYCRYQPTEPLTWDLQARPKP